MALQGKQMRVGACEGFVYGSVKLVLLANCSRYRVDSNTSPLSGKALYPFKALPCPNSDPFFDTHICSLWLCLVVISKKKLPRETTASRREKLPEITWLSTETVVQLTRTCMRLRPSYVGVSFPRIVHFNMPASSASCFYASPYEHGGWLNLGTVVHVVHLLRLHFELL